MLKMKVSHKVISFVMLLIVGVELFSPTVQDVSAEVRLGQLCAEPFAPVTPPNPFLPCLTRSGSARSTTRRPPQVGRCAAAPSATAFRRPLPRPFAALCTRSAPA